MVNYKQFEKFNQKRIGIFGSAITGDLMGELTRFDNIRIYMNFMDTDRHQEPHFHVELSGGKEASISIATGKLLAGKIDNRSHKIIIAWILLHKEELWDRWNKAVSGKSFDRIPPKINL